MAVFQYHSAILTRYPGLVGGVILAHGLTNRPTSTGLLDEYVTEQQTVIKRIGNTPLSQLPSISAWRSVFSSFGVEPTKYRCAAEALLRRLTKKGDIPSINTLVDLGNLVSIRYGLPVAVFDTRQIQGALTVRFAEGAERFVPLGEAVIEQPERGEVIFDDETQQVMARRWCWRQSEESAAQLSTTNAIITVEAHHSTAATDIKAALADLLNLLQKYSTGTFSYAVLDAQQPIISD